MKNKTYATLYLLCLLFALTSCNFNSTYLNREEDKKDAEKVTDEFYKLLEKKEFDKLNSFFSPRFTAVTKPEKLNEFLIATANKLGEIKSEKLDHWESKVVKGSNASANYVLYYIVERTKFQSKETITLTAENNQIKILGYNVNSEGSSKDLPDNLKNGIEALSGHSMDDVRVHFNSDKPAQLAASAYAQGMNIHIVPNQKEHLPHEAWHVVEQKQGRVKATAQLKSNTSVNDNTSLEKAADEMGSKAAKL
ncbi:eCIS core domain-containing protein [Pedobacter roseus]|uniref:DUF4157 domain-containing protein n=1 Tax=Pedobacter roseus TaxID=336820 RepID=A0A7G9QGN6_9SPHI|nr:DUF4157 domain-containing protein [Pedobacter roseus]QNN42511.1 DUF4157 domain-containing protein [Pedobacter roseus]